MVGKVSLDIYTDKLQQDLMTRLSRFEGQVSGVSRMIEQQRPCMEVLQQLASALRGVTKTVLRNYLERCATDAIRSGDKWSRSLVPLPVTTAGPWRQALHWKMHLDSRATWPGS